MAKRIAMCCGSYLLAAVILQAVAVGAAAGGEAGFEAGRWVN